MDNNVLFSAYRTALYEGLLDEKNSPKSDLDLMRKVKRCLDEVQKSFLDGRITFDEVISLSKECMNKVDGPILVWNPGRDICIGLHMAIGAGVLAAWVASGGTLTIGAVAAGGVVISAPVMAALVGGASAATIACILGSCGDC